MLRKFSVKGFRGFKKKLTLDLTKPREYEFNKHLIHEGVVSSGVIYGKNGSGKSCLGFAIFDIVGMLTDNNLAAPLLDQATYINADLDNKCVIFEYEFALSSCIISYSYTKSAPDKIEREKVAVDGRTVLSRNGSEVTFKEASPLHFPALPPSMSAVRYIYRNTTLPVGHPIKGLVTFVEKMLWFRSLRERGYCGYQVGSNNLVEAVSKKGKLKEFQKFLKDVAGLKMKLEVLQDGTSEDKMLKIRYKHRSVDFFRAASTGTQELLLLFYWSTIALDDVSFLFIDEFDAFYHFELAAKIIELITGHLHLQAFFTSHNTYLATNRIMRPDCYFILTNGQITSFADATLRELREGHNLEKLFRSGEFGE